MSTVDGLIARRRSETDRALGEVVADLAHSAVLPTPAVSGCEVAVLPMRAHASPAAQLIRAGSEDWVNARAPWSTR